MGRLRTGREVLSWKEQLFARSGGWRIHYLGGFWWCEQDYSQAFLLRGSIHPYCVYANHLGGMDFVLNSKYLVENSLLLVRSHRSVAIFYHGTEGAVVQLTDVDR